MNTNQLLCLKQLSIILVLTFIDGSKKSNGFSLALIGDPLIPNALITPSNLNLSNNEVTSVSLLKSNEMNVKFSQSIIVVGCLKSTPMTL